MFRPVFVLLFLLACFACKRNDISSVPDIHMEIFPYGGDSLTPFHIDLTGTRDVEDVNENLDMQFDWESDGIWDTLMDGIHPVVHTFSGGGMHYVTAQVIDRTGMTAQKTDSLFIFFQPQFGEMTDTRDGKDYKTVRIGEQWWMAEHLVYGEEIETGRPSTDNQLAEYYNLGETPEEKEAYGGLYTWDEAMNYQMAEGSQGICPEGWHLPSSADWEAVSKNIPTIFLDYYHAPNGPSGLNLELAGRVLLFKQKGNQLEEWTRILPGAICEFWTSTHYQNILRDADGLTVTQEFYKAFVINPGVNSIIDPLSNGFSTSTDFRHRSGDPEFYPKNNVFSTLLTAKSIRCVKN